MRLNKVMPNIEVRQEIYDRLKAKTNNEGGRSPKKVGMSSVIEKALDDQLKYQKKKVPKKE